jgi:hypothetical protein
MKIVIGYPPNWEKIKAAFPAEESEVVMAYGDTIYNPRGFPIRDDLHVHESVHERQHGDDPEKWWDRYIADPQFRIGQEAEAYGAQVKYIRSMQGEKRAVVALSSFAKFLSGPAYGNAITQAKAFEMIRKVSRRKN